MRDVEEVDVLLDNVSRKPLVRARCADRGAIFVNILCAVPTSRSQ
jgi:hypothetical protein